MGQEQLENIQGRDIKKHHAMRESGIRLIEMRQVEIPSFATELTEYAIAAFDEAGVSELANSLRSAEELAFSWVDPDVEK